MSIDRRRLATLAKHQPFIKGRYRNPDRTSTHGLSEFIRWQRETGGRFPPGKHFPLLHPDQSLLAQPAAEPRFTWLGHASFLVQYQQCNLLTDPVLSQRASPVSFAGPKRFTPAALSVEQLPRIHRVCISHNHYDHLDLITVRQLYRRFGDDLQWLVPEGVGAWFRRRGIHNLVELAWWQSTELNDCEAFCVPSQHFSGRGIRDRNLSLWGGWVLDFQGFRLYFAGDTGYGGCFSDIGAVFGGMDVSLLPIGAYAPRWFMSPVHVDPEEAVQIHLDVGSRCSLAMHWGTFVLTDEPMDEPPRRLRQAMEKYRLADAAFRVLQHGETLIPSLFIN